MNWQTDHISNYYLPREDLSGPGHKTLGILKQSAQNNFQCNSCQKSRIKYHGPIYLTKPYPTSPLLCTFRSDFLHTITDWLWVPLKARLSLVLDRTFYTCSWTDYLPNLTWPLLYTTLVVILDQTFYRQSWTGYHPNHTWSLLYTTLVAILGRTFCTRSWTGYLLPLYASM